MYVCTVLSIPSNCMYVCMYACMYVCTTLLRSDLHTYVGTWRVDKSSTYLILQQFTYHFPPRTYIHTYVHVCTCMYIYNYLCTIQYTNLPSGGLLSFLSSFSLQSQLTYIEENSCMLEKKSFRSSNPELFPLDLLPIHTKINKKWGVILVHTERYYPLPIPPLRSILFLLFPFLYINIFFYFEIPRFFPTK